MLITFHTHVTGNQQNYLSKLNVKKIDYIVQKKNTSTDYT